MSKASPPVNISALNIAAASAEDSSVADTEFVSVSTAYVRMKKGKATITSAAIPNFLHYDRARVTFGDVALTGAPTTVTLELLGLDADGIQRSLGTSTHDGAGFPAIEFDITYEKYFLRLATLDGGTTPTVTVKPLFQGYYRAATANA